MSRFKIQDSRFFIATKKQCIYKKHTNKNMLQNMAYCNQMELVLFHKRMPKWKKQYNRIVNMANGVEAISLYTPNNTLINTCHIVKENKNKTKTQDMNL